MEPTEEDVLYMFAVDVDRVPTREQIKSFTAQFPRYAWAILDLAGWLLLDAVLNPGDDDEL